MRLGVDASNLRAGGGVTHLTELLHAADPVAHGFTQVVVWAGKSLLEKIEERPWLVKAWVPALDGGLARRIFWQRTELPQLVRQAGCDALLAPGGTGPGGFQPVITMSRNMLPFEWRELARYRRSPIGLRLLLLRFAQARTLRSAAGVIFLTRYAREAVTRVTGPLNGTSSIIPHGVSTRFFQALRPQSPIEHYSEARPLRLLYVSIVDLYKHQWHVVTAVARLRARGLPLVLDLVGPAYPPALARLRRAIAACDPRGEFVRYAGAAANTQLPMHYAEADVCVFASSCENMPNILLEGMAAGLPIACSNRGPMPEILADAGVYFDPEQPEDIARAVAELLSSPQRRAVLAAHAQQRAQAYSWQRCAGETLEFLAQVVRNYGTPRVVLERC